MVHFVCIGRHSVASVLSMMNNLTILLPFVEPKGALISMLVIQMCSLLWSSLHGCHPGDRTHDSRMKKQCIATRYVILLLLQLLQGTVCAVRCEGHAAWGIVCMVKWHHVTMCMCACICWCTILHSSKSLCIIISEPDSLRFMVGHCGRLIAVADFFKGMHVFYGIVGILAYVYAIVVYIQVCLCVLSAPYMDFIMYGCGWEYNRYPAVKRKSVEVVSETMVKPWSCFPY